MKRFSGFTLLELLVAITLFGIMSAIAYRGLVEVAITDEGPVLIERNQDWGTRGSQYLGPTPLGWTRLPEDMKYWFETRSTASG